MMLTGKQKRFLRSIACKQKAIFQIGKEGLSYNLIEGVSNALRTKELVKISVLQNNDDDLKELAFDLARQTKSELVQIIGHTIVLYKESKEHLIQLP